MFKRLLSWAFRLQLKLSSKYPDVELEEDGRIYPPQLPHVYRQGEVVPPYLKEGTTAYFASDCVVQRIHKQDASYEIRPLFSGGQAMLFLEHDGQGMIHVIGQGRGVILNTEPMLSVQKIQKDFSPEQ